jgi:pseudaminic acid biosynthesis-associated methylase
VATKLAVETDQARVWMGDFGREYTDRNDQTPDELDCFYQENYGITRSKLNEAFLSGISKQARILEVGCNTGTQLLMLQKMGYTSLYGIEIQAYALEHAKARLPQAVLSLACALSIPYPEKCFDLVFTSGVLIHIAPSDLARVLGEIHRCSKKWIWVSSTTLRSRRRSIIEVMSSYCGRETSQKIIATSSRILTW